MYYWPPDAKLNNCSHTCQHSPEKKISHGKIRITVQKFCENERNLRFLKLLCQPKSKNNSTDVKSFAVMYKYKTHKFSNLCLTSVRQLAESPGLSILLSRSPLTFNTWTFAWVVLSCVRPERATPKPSVQPITWPSELLFWVKTIFSNLSKYRERTLSP